MRNLLLLFVTLLFVLKAPAQLACDDVLTQDGIEPWPWAVAQPFPWDNIEGYWKLGDDESTFIRAVVSKPTQDKNKKLLKIYMYNESICNQPYAVGTGYISISEKNVVRSLMNDSQYKYQLKLGLFDSRDILNGKACSRTKLMAASMQIISRVRKSIDKSVLATPEIVPSEARNLLLKKVAIDPEVDCK